MAGLGGLESNIGESIESPRKSLQLVWESKNPNPQKFKKAIVGSIDAGANGVVFFSVNNLSKEHLDILYDITKNPQ